MEETFWDTLPRPLIGLAPMDGITDQACRHIQKKYGQPAVVYTEFVAVERLDVGDAGMMKDFLYDESQRPVIAQVYGHTPERFRRMAVMLCELGFDGIDINMGCPAPSIAHRGAGAGLIRTPDLAIEIVKATKRGVDDWRNGRSLREDPVAPAHLVKQVEARHRALPARYRTRRTIPVSVKTRIGYAAPQVIDWVPRLLEVEPAAIALHGRTLEQGYSGAADWEEIARAAALARGSATLMLGNGDVVSRDDALARSAQYDLDGVLIGRGSNGNPFVFRPVTPGDPGNGDRYRPLQIAVEHARLHEQWIVRGHPQRFLAMRKHLGWYARAIPGASALRRALVQTWSADEVAAIVDDYLAQRRWWGQLPSFSTPEEIVEPLRSLA